MKIPNKNNKNNKDNKNNKSANEFINVADIKGNFLYTKDNSIISFIKLSTVSISTMSNMDIKILLKILCSEFTGFDTNIRFFKISRPVDISNLIRSYKEMYKNSTDSKQKELLRGATLFLHNHSTDGSELENQHYMIVSSKNTVELERKVSTIKNKFAKAKIETEVLGYEEIARLCNLFVNPAYSNENIELSQDISVIEEFTEDIGDESL